MVVLMPERLAKISTVERNVPIQWVAGKRRLAAPSLLHVCGASLPVGGPVNVSRPLRFPEVADPRKIDRNCLGQQDRSLVFRLE